MACSIKISRTGGSTRGEAAHDLRGCPLTSFKNVKRGEMDKKVGSRIDKPNVDECEHDKKRMQESRVGEITSGKERHDKALTDKDNELTELASSHKRAVTKFEATKMSGRK
jgi:hypothetical protein